MASASRNVQTLAGRLFDRVLIIKPSSLGDIVHALPVLHGLSEAWPNTRIDWLVATPFVPLLEGHPHIHELIPFDRRRFGRMVTRPAVAREFLRFCRGLRLRRYDLVIDLQGLFRSAWLARATRAALRVGFKDAREGAPLFYNRRIQRFPADTHAMDRNLAVLEMFGIAAADRPCTLSVQADAARDMAEVLAHAGVDADHPVVAVVPGGRWETKTWLPERFSELIDAVHNRTEARCVLLGAPDEADLCAAIAAACADRPIDLAGRTSLPQLVAAIGRADLVLCHDSAAAHLAAALDRRLVCLIGPTNPRRTGPYRRMADVLQVPLDCAPCYLRKLAQCRNGHRCMRDLSVSTVVEAVCSRLA